MNEPCALIGRWLTAAVVSVGTVAGASPPQQAAIETRGEGSGLANALIAPTDDSSSWRMDRNRDAASVLPPLMTRKTREFYYAVPVGPAVTLKPGVSHFKQPRDAFGGTSGRTVIGVSASFRLGL